MDDHIYRIRRNDFLSAMGLNALGGNAELSRAKIFMACYDASLGSNLGEAETNLIAAAIGGAFALDRKPVDAQLGYDHFLPALDAIRHLPQAAKLSPSTNRAVAEAATAVLGNSLPIALTRTNALIRIDAAVKAVEHAFKADHEKPADLTRHAQRLLASEVYNICNTEIRRYQVRYSEKLPDRFIGDKAQRFAAQSFKTAMTLADPRKPIARLLQRVNAWLDRSGPVSATRAMYLDIADRTAKDSNISRPPAPM